MTIIGQSGPSVSDAYNIVYLSNDVFTYNHKTTGDIYTVIKVDDDYTFESNNTETNDKDN